MALPKKGGTLKHTSQPGHGPRDGGRTNGGKAGWHDEHDGRGRRAGVTALLPHEQRSPMGWKFCGVIVVHT